MTDNDYAGGCYAYRDLESLGIVRGRVDLQRKQKKHGFPKPIKTGNRQASFLKSEVHAWLHSRVEQRDAEDKKPSSRKQLANAS